MSEFFVESILGLDTGKALVVVTLNKEEITCEVEEARKMAMMLLEAAMASEQDKMLFEYLTEQGRLTVQSVAVMLQELRNYRQTKAEQ